MTTDNFCFYLQNRPIQTGQAGGQQYSDTLPFSIPWPKVFRSKDIAPETLYKMDQALEFING
jgi:hypothetical protein